MWPRGQVAGVFEYDLILAQLKYTGMLDTLRIRAQGYPKQLLVEATPTPCTAAALFGCMPACARWCVQLGGECWGLQDFVSGYRFMDKNASTPEALVSAIEQILPDLVAANKVRTLSLPMHPL